MTAAPGQAMSRRGAHASAFVLAIVGLTSGSLPVEAQDTNSITVRREQSRPAPRSADGTIRLDAAPGEKGFWGNASASSLFERGGTMTFDARGLLSELDQAAEVAPFMPWSLALYRHRQATNLVDDPIKNCISPAGPRHLQTAPGFRMIQDDNLDRVYLLFGGGNRNWRIIHLDGRQSPDPEEVVGTYFGYSSGQWQGDTLVVESSGFNDRFWFSQGGLPHTAALRLTERFTRTDFDTLNYSVTINDPLTYTRPWIAEWTLEWIQGGEIQEQFCEQ